MSTTENHSPSASCPLDSTSAPARRWTLFALTWLTALAVFMIYLSTAAPNAWWGDGLELSTAAWVLGIPHPPGYPLFTILLHGWMNLLGWMDPGRAATLFNAICLALSAGLLAGWFRRLILGDPAGLGAGAGCRCGLAATTFACALALFIAFARTVWEHATFVEVYPLTFLGIVILLRISDAQPANASRLWRRILALALVLGLLALNHYSFLAYLPLAAFIALDWTRPHPRRRLQLLAAALALFLICLLGYLYLPLRAQSNPPLNWGNPSNLERLAWTLSGGQFRTLKVGGEGPVFLRSLAEWLAWWAYQWIPATRWDAPLRLQPPPAPAVLGGLFLVLTAGWGLALLARRRLAMAAGLVAAILITLGFTLFYRIPDIEPYILPALPAAALGWIVAGQWLAVHLQRQSPRLAARPYWRILLLLGAVVVASGHYSAIDKSWDDTPLLWSENVMAALPHEAVVLTGGDNDIYALWYRQIVLADRPDVPIIGTNFIFSGWYARYFESAGRPDLPVLIREQAPRGKLDFDVALLANVILPLARTGRPLYATYRDPLVEDLLNAQPVAGLLPAAYYEITPYDYGLPSPVLLKLEVPETLIDMAEPRLREHLTRFIRQRIQAGDQRYLRLYAGRP